MFVFGNFVECSPNRFLILDSLDSAEHFSPVKRPKWLTLQAEIRVQSSVFETTKKYVFELQKQFKISKKIFLVVFWQLNYAKNWQFSIAFLWVEKRKKIAPVERLKIV